MHGGSRSSVHPDYCQISRYSIPVIALCEKILRSPISDLLFLHSLNPVLGFRVPWDGGWRRRVGWGVGEEGDRHLVGIGVSAAKTQSGLASGCGDEDCAPTMPGPNPDECVTWKQFCLNEWLSCGWWSCGPSSSKNFVWQWERTIWRPHSPRWKLETYCIYMYHSCPPLARNCKVVQESYSCSWSIASIQLDAGCKLSIYTRSALIMSSPRAPCSTDCSLTWQLS